ncbi:ROK family protein [Microlunatus sp. GCM10028923]|uniref:ROK family transcriptional regulator n=1 Tax=Microlunatus sp. GCM10028923 TaxID=3273400 RepID=UPI00360A8223
MAVTGSGGRAGLLSPAAIGRTNRSRVLELLHRDGPASRAQLARALGVNRATITSILTPLIDNGTLVEGASVAASPAGGKPARPVWFRPDGPELGSMRIAPHAIIGARLGVDGTIRHQVERPIDASRPLAEIEQTIFDVAHECFDDASLLGVGIAASGTINTASGSIISLQLAPVLNHYPATERLGRELGVPVYIDHHPRVQALGDKWFGHGRGLASFASVYTGEALGFGLVYDHEIVRGEQGAGGEYGHTVVDLHGLPCPCGRIGCWETIATLNWLRAEAERRGLPEPTMIDCGRLTALADQDHPEAADLLQLYAQNLAVGLANNEQMIASGRYLMHGDVCAGGTRMRELLERWLVVYSPDRDGVTPTVIMADPTERMTLLGGGALALSAAFATIL